MAPRIATSSLLARVQSMLLALENAPLDDEPLTDEDRAAIEAARAEVRRGEVYTTEQVRSVELNRFV